MIDWPTVHDRFLDLPDGRLHYVEAGSGDPIIFLHGGHGAWTHWVANIAHFARTRRVLALDQPGFAESYVPKPEYTLDQYAQTVSQVMDALQLERVALAGFSFGTVVAVATAGREPTRVTHVALANPPDIGPRNPEVDPIRLGLSKLSKEQGLREGAIGSLKEMQLYNHDLIDDEVIALLMKQVRGTRRITSSLSNSGSMLELLGRVKQSLLVLAGEFDRQQYHKPEEREANVLRVAPQARFVRVPRSRHWMAFDRADAYNEIVSDFINRP